MKLMLFISLAMCSVAFAQSADGLHSISCSYESEDTTRSLGIRFQVSNETSGKIGDATFEYIDIWRGFYPYHHYDHGSVAGTAIIDTQGINGRFELIIFGSSKVLVLKNSEGELDMMGCKAN